MEYIIPEMFLMQTAKIMWFNLWISLSWSQSNLYGAHQEDGDYYCRVESSNYLGLILPWWLQMISSSTQLNFC